MPAYLGDAHHCSTALTCSSYRASSAAPGLADSGSNWKESEGRDVFSGDDSCGRTLPEGILQGAVDDIVRIARVGTRRARNAARMAGRSILESNPSSYMLHNLDFRQRSDIIGGCAME